jgi:hypothetical protein
MALSFVTDDDVLPGGRIVRNSKVRLTIPTYSGSTLTSGTSPDSEHGLDGAAPTTDLADEWAAITTGIGQLDLDHNETDGATVVVQVKGTGIDTRALVFQTEVWPIIRSGTAQAGAATSITLDANASEHDDAYNDMYVYRSNDTPADAQGAIRRVTNYVGSTKVATVATWGTATNPTSSSTFDIIVPPEMYVGAIAKLHDNYYARVTLIQDSGTDRWTVIQFYNGVVLAAADDDANPDIRVFDQDDGSDLLSSALTQVTGEEAWYYEETTNIVTAGRAYGAEVTIHHNGQDQTFIVEVEGRDV